MGRLTTVKPRAQTLQRGPGPAPKVAQAFYLTPSWRKARELALALGAHRCAHCARRGCVLYVDHIRELSDGGAPFDQSNLEPLCGRCHTLKTTRTRADRQREPGRAPIAGTDQGRSSPGAPGRAGAPGADDQDD